MHIYSSVLLRNVERNEIWHSWNFGLEIIILLQSVERHGLLTDLGLGIQSLPLESLRWFRRDHMGKSFQIRHFRLSDSLLLWLEFCVNTFSGVSILWFPNHNSSHILHRLNVSFLKGSSNLLSLVFQSSGLERPELQHTSVQGFGGNKKWFLLLAPIFHLYAPIHWILPS